MLASLLTSFGEPIDHFLEASSSGAFVGHDAARTSPIARDAAAITQAWSMECQALAIAVAPERLGSM